MNQPAALSWRSPTSCLTGLMITVACFNLQLAQFVSNLSAVSSDRVVYLFISDFMLLSPARTALGYPDRTPACCCMHDKKHKKMALVFSVRPVGCDQQPPLSPLWFLPDIWKPHIDRHKPELLSLPFPWLPGWRVPSPTACGVGLVGLIWFDPVA